MGYTQTSFWDLKSSSAPFEDTSYKPELLWLSNSLVSGGFLAKGQFLESGFQHESNGRGGDFSSARNSLFIGLIGERSGSMAIQQNHSAAFITSKDTLDGVYPGLILGINARRMGMKTSVFYTFMGINVIRKGWVDHARFNPPGFMGAIPGMSAVATWMMKDKMEKANIPALPDLQEMAIMEGVSFVACQMTVDMMKLKPSDFIDGVSIQTAEDFLKQALDCKILLYT